jgi:hypothetical protein
MHLSHLDGQLVCRSRFPQVTHKTCMWLARSLQACSLRTKSYLDLQPYLSKGSDKVPIALVKAQKAAAVGRHGR